MWPTSSTPRASRPEQPGAGDSGRDGDERRRQRAEGTARSRRGSRSWRPRPRASAATSPERARRSRASFGRKEPARDVEAEELRHLVEHDDDADARLEPDQHRLGDEVGDEAEPQDRTPRPGSPPRAASASPTARRSAAGSPAGTAPARSAPVRMASVVVVLTLSTLDVPRTRVDEHRHERRVEPDLDRQSGDRGVGHRLGNDDGRRGQAGDDVEPEPVGPVREHPTGQREAAASHPVACYGRACCAGER